MTLWTGRCFLKCILETLSRVLFFALMAGFGAAALTSHANAMWLSVYGNVGYDSVSSKPAEANPDAYVEPNPSGPSYGLGVSIEPMRFSDNMFGISVGSGLSGWSLAWSTSQEGKIPAGVSVSTIGLGINGAFNVYFGDLFLYLIGQFDYGLFSSSYVLVRNGDSKNPSGQTINNTVNSMMRLFAGLGVGYNISGFKVALQAGLANVAINLTPPATSAGKQPSAADDSYAGWSAQLVLAYDILAPSSKSNNAEAEASEGKKSDKKKKSKKKTKKKQPKKK